MLYIEMFLSLNLYVTTKKMYKYLKFIPKRRCHILFLLLMISFSCKKENSINETKRITSIAFGSCGNQWTKDWSIFNAIKRKNPDIYIALGDNMYADVGGLETQPFYPFFVDLGYQVLSQNQIFSNFKKQVPIIATWDDHDYGKNNGGNEFDHKQAAKDAFMKFWNISNDNDMRTRDGVYSAYYYGEGNERVQILMLDTRWFLDVISNEPIAATSDTTKKILGEQEWAWLEEELRKPAALRIIGSSTQFATEHNGYEAWANYPHQMERFYTLLKKTKAEGTFFISGDVHYAEINKRVVDGLYPIFDATSSGLTHSEEAAKPSIYRIGEPYVDLNFGIIRINWETNPVLITQEIYSKSGDMVLNNVISLNELKF